MDRRDYRDKRLRPVSHGLCCFGAPDASGTRCDCQCHPKSRIPQSRDKAERPVAVTAG